MGGTRAPLQGVYPEELGSGNGSANITMAYTRRGLHMVLLLHAQISCLAAYIPP